MTRLYIDRPQHQLTLKVDQRRLVLKAESMSSPSDGSDDLPPPDDDVDAAVISRVYGLGRKPTTIALSFRPPRKPRATHKLPKLVSKTTRRCPGNVTSPDGDVTSFRASCHSDASHVTSGRHALATSKSMHSLTKTTPDANHCVPASGGNGIKTVSECHRSVTSSSKAVDRLNAANALASSDWKLTRNSNDNAARATSVTPCFILSYYDTNNNFYLRDYAMLCYGHM